MISFCQSSCTTLKNITCLLTIHAFPGWSRPWTQSAFGETLLPLKRSKPTIQAPTLPLLQAPPRRVCNAVATPAQNPYPYDVCGGWCPLRDTRGLKSSSMCNDVNSKVVPYFSRVKLWKWRIAKNFGSPCSIVFQGLRRRDSVTGKLLESLGKPLRGFKFVKTDRWIFDLSSSRNGLSRDYKRDEA